MLICEECYVCRDQLIHAVIIGLKRQRRSIPSESLTEEAKSMDVAGKKTSQHYRSSHQLLYSLFLGSRTLYKVMPLLCHLLAISQKEIVKEELWMRDEGISFVRTIEAWSETGVEHPSVCRFHAPPQLQPCGVGLGFGSCAAASVVDQRTGITRQHR